LTRISAGEPATEVAEDLGRRLAKHGCNTVHDLPEQHDARYGDVVGRDGAETVK
jgi:hypothetical protein